MKSKERTKQTGEVFTPTKLVKEMLDHLPDDAWEEGKTFLDNSCGNAQFLAYVLQEKINRGHSDPLKYIYGVDLMADNVCDTIARLILIKTITGDFHNPDGTITKISGEYWNPDGTPSKDINHPGHRDDHSYDWLIANTSYERKYSEITVRLKGFNPGKAAVFEYQLNGETSWTPVWNIVCYDALKYDYEFEHELCELTDALPKPAKPAKEPKIKLPKAEPAQRLKVELPKPETLKINKELEKPVEDSELLETLETLQVQINQTLQAPINQTLQILQVQINQILQVQINQILQHLEPNAVGKKTEFPKAEPTKEPKIKLPKPEKPKLKKEPLKPKKPIEISEHLQAFLQALQHLEPTPASKKARHFTTSNGENFVLCSKKIGCNKAYYDENTWLVLFQDNKFLAIRAQDYIDKSTAHLSGDWTKNGKYSGGDKIPKKLMPYVKELQTIV